MSDLLDPSSRFHLQRIGVGTGWRCLEVDAGNGSLSQWLVQCVGPAGHVIASDIPERTRIRNRDAKAEPAAAEEPSSKSLGT